MSRRSYRQYCSIAKALDLLGERWTLLIVRELLTGPKRYKDLREGLPGIGTNLLADRLKEMVENRVVAQRKLPPPAGSTVYELTERGHGLEPVLRALANWGERLLGDPGEDDAFLPSWALAAMKFNYRREVAEDLRETYQLNIGETVFHVTVDRGDLDTLQGPARRPAVTLITDEKTFFELASGRRGLEEAVAEKAVRIEGSPQALQRLARLYQRPSSD